MALVFRKTKRMLFVIRQTSYQVLMVLDVSNMRFWDPLHFVDQPATIVPQDSGPFIIKP